MVTNTCIHTSVTHQFGVLFLQGAAGAGFATHAALDKKTEDSQAKLRHAQSSLERWQQSLADLVPSSSGRLDAGDCQVCASSHMASNTELLRSCCCAVTSMAGAQT